MEDFRLTQHNPKLVRFYSLSQLGAFFLALVAGLAVASQILVGGAAIETFPPPLRLGVEILGGSEATALVAVIMAIFAAGVAVLLNRGTVLRSVPFLLAAAGGTWAFTAVLLVRNVVAGDFNVLMLSLDTSPAAGVERWVALTLDYALTFGIALGAFFFSCLALAMVASVKGEPVDGISVAPGMKIRTPGVSDLTALEALYVGSLVKDGKASTLLHAGELWSSLELRKKLKNTRVLSSHDVLLGFYVAHGGRKSIDFFMVAAGHRRRGYGAFLYRDFKGQANGRLAGWTYTPVETLDRNFFLAKGWVRSGSGDNTLTHG